MTAMTLPQIAARLTAELSPLSFRPAARYVYNPLEYARAPHLAYLSAYGAGCRRVILVGMNPGPWGMAQTGVPFGDVAMVRDWLAIEAPVTRPRPEHPRRPVEGFSCRRREVSGTRLWGWARDRFETPRRFFARFFVANYCPLLFLDDAGRNITPDKLPAASRKALVDVCDRALLRLAEAMEPALVMGIGRFAEERVAAALDGLGVQIGHIPHPSPASPAANRGWAAAADAALTRHGVCLPKWGRPGANSFASEVPAR